MKTERTTLRTAFVSLSAIIMLSLTAWSCSQKKKGEPLQKEQYSMERINEIGITEPRRALAMIDTVEERGLMSGFEINRLRAMVYHNGLSDNIKSLEYALKAYNAPEARESIRSYLRLIGMISDQYYLNGDYQKSVEFRDYWFQTGTPTMLIKLLKKHHVDIDQLEGARRSDTQLLSIDPTMRDPVPVLFQSGYLTIKEAIRRGTNYMFRLGFPNQEVERGFLNDLLPYYVNRDVRENDLDIFRFIDALEEKDVDGFINMLRSLLVGVSFSSKKRNIDDLLVDEL